MLPANGYESPRPRSTETGELLYINGSTKAIDRDGRRRPPSRECAGENMDYIDGDETISQTQQGDTSAMERGQGGQEGGQRTYGIRDRISYYTWTWFTMTMATGGVANVIHASKYPK
jgi:hypothetical protein